VRFAPLGPCFAVSLLVAAVLGCGDGDDASADPVPISIAVTAPGGSCTGDSATQTIADLGATTMRLTVSLRDDEGALQLLCDEGVDLDVDEGALALALDTSSADRMDLLVEVFDDAQPPGLLASGAVVGINRRPRLGPLEVLLSRAGSSSCTPGPMGAQRAFHSATALPNGEVFLVGGLTPSDVAGFEVQATIEVYDPGTGLFRTAEGDLPQGRAFHSAVLLDAPSDQSAFDLLLVGGVATPGFPQPAIAIGVDGDALPFAPMASARAADSVVVRYFPWTDPPQVQQMVGSPSLLGRLFHSAATAGGELVVTGGIRAPEYGLAQTGDDLELISTAAAHRGPYPLLHSRVGAVAAPLADDRLLVFGGNLLSAVEELVAESAEVVTLSDGSSAAVTFEPESIDLVASVAHATLTPIADGLLLAGGLQVEPGSARSVVDVRPVLRLAPVADSLRLEEVPTADYDGAAYHAAVALPGGDVLLVGGMPPGCAAPCASDVVVRYSATEHQIVPESALLVARLGHAATVLESGAILVSGGLASGPAALAEAELLVPRADAEAVDLFGRRAGEVSATRCQ